MNHRSIKRFCIMAMLVAQLGNICAAEESAKSPGDIKYVGVGLTIVESDDHKQFIVGGFIADSPASHSNLKEGDELVQIDGKQVQSLDAIVAQLHGPVDSMVEVTVKRDGQLLRTNLLRTNIVIHQSGGMCRKREIKH
ncbi:MAG: PDZ domain-containing protein [Candidatus Obscuribacterales bacterium]|nr:PDZ domain-containing protein [Candidatus Obscuribacterales bacterium]